MRLGEAQGTGLRHGKALPNTLCSSISWCHHFTHLWHSQGGWVRAGPVGWPQGVKSGSGRAHCTAWGCQGTSLSCRWEAEAANGGLGGCSLQGSTTCSHRVAQGLILSPCQSQQGATSLPGDREPGMHWRRLSSSLLQTKTCWRMLLFWEGGLQLPTAHPHHKTPLFLPRGAEGLCLQRRAPLPAVSTCCSAVAKAALGRAVGCAGCFAKPRTSSLARLCQNRCLGDCNSS